MTLEKLFGDFIQSGLYLKGWSVKTPIIYRQALTSFQRSLPEKTYQKTSAASPLTKAQLEAWIVNRRQAGMSASCCNIYMRAMNSFCSWLKENDHVKEHIVLK
jgi:site-specific recombinase XerD